MFRRFALTFSLAAAMLLLSSPNQAAGAESVEAASMVECVVEGRPSCHRNTPWACIITFPSGQSYEKDHCCDPRLPGCLTTE